MKIILFIAILIPAIFQAQNKYELNFENASSFSEDSLKKIEKHIDQITFQIKTSIKKNTKNTIHHGIS